MKIKKLTKSLGGIAFNFSIKYLKPFERKVLILMYHRVMTLEPDQLYDPAMYVTPETLDMHINEIKKYFDVVAIDSINLNDIGTKPKCVITFDDGWRDNYYHAFPVLKKHDVPATIFLTVNMIGTDSKFWFHSLWDLINHTIKTQNKNNISQYLNSSFDYSLKRDFREDEICDFINYLKKFPAQEIEEKINKAYEYLKITPSDDPVLLDWDQVRIMGQGGISFGSHSLNHYILPSVDDETKLHEISQSFDAIKIKNINISSYFCYPNGSWDNKTVEFVKKSRYTGAVTTHLGTNSVKINRFLLNRIEIHDEIANTPSLFWFRLFQSMV